MELGRGKFGATFYQSNTQKINDTADLLTWTVKWDRRYFDNFQKDVKIEKSCETLE